MSTVRIINADVLAGLAQLGDESVQCCVTSPPYWGLRDYGVAGQIGLEATPEEYVGHMADVFREVKRVLRKDGTLWLNMGDCYFASRCGARDAERWPKQSRNDHRVEHSRRVRRGKDCDPKRGRAAPGQPMHACGGKPKDLVGMPWRLAFALQADGWYLRSDIVWHKPNPMPEGVTDRPTKAHEYVFLVAKAERYYYDAEAIKEDCVYGDHPRNGVPGTVVQSPGQPIQSGITKRRASGNRTRGVSSRVYGGASNATRGFPWQDEDGKRNARTVWTINTQPYPEAHFATFPEELPRRCILAGCPAGGTVLDPFGGAGTTGLVAARLGRNAVLIELNPKYADMARARIERECPLMAVVKVDKGSDTEAQ